MAVTELEWPPRHRDVAICACYKIKSRGLEICPFLWSFSLLSPSYTWNKKFFQWIWSYYDLFQTYGQERYSV